MIRFLCFAVTFILTIESAQSNDTIFTKAQANSIKERIEKVKEGGIRYICSLNGRRYYFYSSSDDDTANSISKKFNIPIDTLLILSEAGRMDYDIEMNVDKDRASFWKRVQDTFFINPNTPMGELGKKNKCGNLSFYFVCDPTIIVKKERDFNEGSFKYCILSDIDRTVEVACFSNSDSIMSKIKIPDHVIYKGVTYTVLAIGKRAFLNCEQIENVSMSNGVIEIGDEAFRGCKGIKSANIPNSVTYIGKFAFADCVGLTSITLNTSNISIGEKVFDNCKNVNNFTIPDDLQIDGMDLGGDCGNTIRNYIVKRSKIVSPQQQLVKDNNRLQEETNSNQNDNRTIANSRLKQYRGNFKMVGFGYDIGRIDGVATYYYTDAYDGTRIFEGDFTFEGVRGSQNKIHYKTMGKFKNDKQVGQWKWVIVDNQGYREEITETTINFDENGVPNGNFETWKGTDKSSKWSWMSCRFENGKISSASFHDGDLLIASGKYNSDGKPIGEWNITGKKVQNKNCHCLYASDGYCISSYYVDETTGDKIDVSSKYPYEIFYKILSRVQKTRFRSTPEIR